MSDEKQSKIDEILAQGKWWSKGPFKVALIAFVVVLMILGSLVTFLQLKTFDIVQDKQSVSDYMTEVRDTLVYEEEGFVVTVPEEVIGQLAMDYVSNVIEGQSVQLDSLVYDASVSRVKMNLTYMGFYLPLSMKIAFEQEGNIVRLKYTKAGTDDTSDIMGRVIKGLTHLGNAQQTVNLNDFKALSDMTLTSLQTVDGLPVLTLKVGEQRLKDLVSDMTSHISEQMLTYYSEFEDDGTQLVLKLVESSSRLSSTQVRLIVNDMVKDQDILYDILMMTENYPLDDLKVALESYGLELDEDRVRVEKLSFMGQAIDDDVKKIFEALDQHFGERILAFNQGKPFDLDTMTTMTITELAETYELTIEEEVLDRMSFVYDEAFKVAYQMDGDTYYIRGIDGYALVSEEDYRQYQGAGSYTEPYFVNDLNLWNDVVAAGAEYLSTEGMFVRYMKTDGESVFAVMSPVTLPQEIYGMAMVKHEDGLQVLDAQVTSIASLIAEYPEFNVATGTRAIENMTFKRIGSDIHDYILEQLYGKKKITSISDTTIVYSSYDGKKYIAFKLSNGDEYVYKIQNTVYGSYLTDLYTKVKAKRNWSDIPALLMLQDPPAQ